MRSDPTFIGEISEPYLSPTITQGLVEFVVHPLQGEILRNNQAQLISASGATHLVTVREQGVFTQVQQRKSAGGQETFWRASMV